MLWALRRGVFTVIFGYIHGLVMRHIRGRLSVVIVFSNNDNDGATGRVYTRFCVPILLARETAQKYAVQSMPTFVFIKNGKKVDELKGAGEDALRQSISRNI